MFKISCKDLGKKDDDFVAEGMTKEDVKSKLMAHAMSDHKMEMETMSKEDKDAMMMKVDGMLDSQM